MYEESAFMSDGSGKSTNKFRFWLGIATILLAAIFGVLALAAFAAGRGLAGEGSAEQAADTILIFNLLGTAFLAFIPACLWLVFKLQPRD